MDCRDYQPTTAQHLTSRYERTRSKRATASAAELSDSFEAMTVRPPFPEESLRTSATVYASLPRKTQRCALRCPCYVVCHFFKSDAYTTMIHYCTT